MIPASVTKVALAYTGNAAVFTDTYEARDHH
jgi:hypothetical protein